MTKEEAIKIINQVGEDFGWQMGKVGANYENGYMKAIRDVKQAFDHIVDSNKMIVTNADRIKKQIPEMTIEQLANFLDGCPVKGNCRHAYCEKCLKIWLKEKVE